jgi:two-component system LytT family response regulator
VLKKIGIVDDEKIARDRMLRFLGSFPEKFEVFEAANGVEAVEKILTQKPQVVFLDIQMPEMSGFDVLYQLPERDFQIVFQTAFDEFAVKAFEVNACDYLLKPYTEEKFHSALAKALREEGQGKILRQLEEHLKKSARYLKTLTVKQGSRIKILSLEDVFLFKSEDHYTFAVTAEGEYIVDLSLSILEEKIDPTAFFRCHRNGLVKVSEIDKVGAAENSNLILKSGLEVAISREGRKKLIRKLEL